MGEQARGSSEAAVVGDEGVVLPTDGFAEEGSVGEGLDEGRIDGEGSDAVHGADLELEGSARYSLQESRTCGERSGRGWLGCRAAPSVEARQGSLLRYCRALLLDRVIAASLNSLGIHLPGHSLFLRGYIIYISAHSAHPHTGIDPQRCALPLQVKCRFEAEQSCFFAQARTYRKAGDDPTQTFGWCSHNPRC